MTVRNRRHAEKTLLRYNSTANTEQATDAAGTHAPSLMCHRHPQP
jgi:hypothetical protein